MVFAHDTEVALIAAAEMVNTAHEDPDPFATPAGLEEFVTRWRWTGTLTGDEAELAGVRALRPRLERLWHADRDEAVELVNAMLRETQALPQLVRHDEWDYHLHGAPPEADLAVRMGAEAGMALVDVIRTDELDRLRVCAGAGCANVLVDLSRNRSRRFCEAGCGNRENVAAYRARRSARSSRA